MKRYIIATLTGTITGKKQEYIQGVYNFPVIDNPVWYVMEEELKAIFDYKDNTDDNIDFKNDYYLPIGTSPVFNDFEVKINPDKLFCKHAAVLGNTGCGKSCTIATLLQSVFTYKIKSKDGNELCVRNAHFVIFDTNGEYKKAFEFKDEELKNRVNAFTINNEGLKVPYWFMNYEDFEYLFQPGPGAQTPILKRAIELARNKYEAEKEDETSRIIINLLQRTHEYCCELNKSSILKEVLYLNFETFKDLGLIDQDEKRDDYIKRNENNYYILMDKFNSNFKEELCNRIDNMLYEIYTKSNDIISIQEQNVDIPIWFDFEKMIDECIDSAIEEQEASDNRLREYISTLRLRLKAYYNDERYAKPFMFRNKNEADLLSDFIQYILGILSSEGHQKKANGENNNDYSSNDNPFVRYKYMKDKDQKLANFYSEKNNNQVTIIDLSLLPYEVLENIIGLISRLILEFLLRLERIGEKRGSIPVVIVLEEAQNYIPEIDKDSERKSISKRVFERIAREGRKYGLSLLIASQRPSELSKTILSQCNTFIVHRIQNPEDQKYIKQVVSSVNEDILDQLPVLPQQHAIVLGDAVRSPIQVRMRDAYPKPDSDNPEYFGKWISDGEDAKLTKEKVDRVTNEWLGKKNKKESKIKVTITQSP